MSMPSPTPRQAPRYVKLDNVDHADLTVAVRHDTGDGDAVNQCLLFPTEFEEAQRDFPILFRREAGGAWYAVALTGFDTDENLFLRRGRWTSGYIPAAQQRGPFATDPAGEDGPDDGGAPAVWIDLDDPRVGAEGGEPLFLRHGGTAPYLAHVTQVLRAMRSGHAVSAPFYATLERHGLLKPVALDVAIDDGLSYRIDDVHAIDEERLAALEGAALADLHANGALRAATMAAASLGTVARLIALKRSAIAAAVSA